MGTGVGTHANGSTVQRIGGNYNIVDNTVHFASAPFGGIPIGTDTMQVLIMWIGLVSPLILHSKVEHL